MRTPREIPGLSVQPVARAALAAAGAIAVGCVLSLVTTLIAVRLDRAGFSSRAVGFNAAAGGIATLVSAPLVPWAARRLGVARLLTAAFLAGATCMALFALSDAYAVWLGLRFAEGVCVTTMFVLVEYWIATAAVGRGRGIAIGAYVMCLTVGFAAGPQLLAHIGTAGPLPFLIGGAAFAAAVGPLLLQASGAPTLAKTTSRRSPLRIVADMPAATFAALLHGAIEVAGLTFLPVYALRAGESFERGASFSSLFVIGSLVFQLPIGALAEKVDRFRLLSSIAVAGLVGAVLLACLDPGSRFLFGGTLVLWGGLVGVLYPVGLGALGARYRDGDLASANSVFVMMYATGMLIGPPLVGVGLDLLPPAGLFWAIALLIALYVSGAGVAQARRLAARPASSRSIG